WVPPVVLGVVIFCGGHVFGRLFPATGMTGWQAFFWGFVLSTVVLYHATYTINSLAHRFGSRRFATEDDSRNNFALALLTLGEGWHNNHHHYSASVRQGFYWWEVDMTYYCLKGLEWLGLIWDVRGVPDYVREGKPDRIPTAAYSKRRWRRQSRLRNSLPHSLSWSSPPAKPIPHDHQTLADQPSDQPGAARIRWLSPSIACRSSSDNTHASPGLSSKR
ncbi:MAG: acyl-CoA desaturase, partial [Nitrospira sp.]|nr:acyl-CoA desaturase [Nitrospira sp.]